MTTYEKVLKRYNVKPGTKYIEIEYSRGELPVLFKHLGLLIGAEIGVDRGWYSEEICRTNPEVKLFCIDPWKFYDENDDPKKNQHALNINHHCTIKRLKSYNHKIIRKTSMEAVKDFEPESLDFVYLDGNHHFKYIEEDLREWYKIVKKGGIIGGHDYKGARRPLPDVGRAVDAFVEKHGIETLFVCRKFYGSNYFFVK